MLELHIWGPAFELPSIDAECISAVAYLSQVLSPDEYTIIPAHDTSLSPTKDFPALRDGSKWVGGYHAIVRHIKQTRANGDLDVKLDEQQQADRIAFASFIESHFQLLIDLSLYISYENYSTITRPSFTRILPYHSNYTSVPSRREAARARTAHLGLQSLDVDDTHESLSTGMIPTPSERYEAEKRAAGLSDAKPKGIPLPFGRSKSVLKQAQYTTKFKLATLSSNTLSTLSELLADKSYLLSNDDEPSSLDCLAFGYLAIMLYPILPNPFLKSTLTTEFPTLHSYTQRLRNTILGAELSTPSSLCALSTIQQSPTDLSAARKNQNLRLPWSPFAPSPILNTASTITRWLLSALPALGPVISAPVIRHMDPMPPPSLSILFMQHIIGITTGLQGVLAGLAYYQLVHVKRREPLIFEREDIAARRRRGFGEAGGFLSALGNRMDAVRTGL